MGFWYEINTFSCPPVASAISDFYSFCKVHLQNCEKGLSFMSACLSIHLHGTFWLPLDGFL